MTYRWDPQGVNMRKPLRISWCGATPSGLRIANGAGTQYYPKYGNPRAWLTGADMPVRWDTDASGVLPYSSSDFTGEMHAYAQVLMTHPRALDLFAPGGSGFRADWAYTHGLYLQTLTNGSLRPWCIAVSAAGVFARILPHCKVAAGYTAPAKPADPPGGATPEEIQQWEDDSKKWDAEKFKELHGYYPLAPANAAWFDTVSDWTQLADAAAVATFYALSPFYERCGWAFDSTGAHAVNTGYRYIDNGSSHGYLCSEYVITITADADGAPVSATISLTSSGYARYVWNGTAGAPTRLAVPATDGSLIKFSLALSDTAKTVIGSDGERAPLISWYAADGTLDGFEHINSAISTQTLTLQYSSGTPLPMGDTVDSSGTEYSGNNDGVAFKGGSAPSINQFAGVKNFYHLYQFGHSILYKIWPDTTIGGSKIYPPQSAVEMSFYTETYDGDEGQIEESAAVIATGARAGGYLYQYTDQNESKNVTVSAYGTQRARTGNTGNCSQMWFVAGPYNSSQRSYCKSISEPIWRISFSQSVCDVITPGSNAQNWWAGDAVSPSLCSGYVNFFYDADVSKGSSYSMMTLPQITAGDYVNKTRTETLTLRVSGKSDIVAHSDIETLTQPGEEFQRIKDPYGGNPYLWEDQTGQRMYTWHDNITGELVYSKNMNGDTGADFGWVDNQSYPLATLSPTVMHSWVGVPGNFTI